MLSMVLEVPIHSTIVVVGVPMDGSIQMQSTMLTEFREKLIFLDGLFFGFPNLFEKAYVEWKHWLYLAHTPPAWTSAHLCMAHLGCIVILMQILCPCHHL